MKFPRYNSKIFFLFIVLALSLFFAASCAGTTDSNGSQNVSNDSASPEKTKASKDNAEELSSLIKLPETPEEAVWREDEVENQKGKKLIAVLKYNDEKAGKIIASAEKIKPPAPIQMGAEDWFPAELTAQTQLSGNESFKGVVYGANDFFNPPYQNGRLIRVRDTNFFVLELTTY